MQKNFPAVSVIVPLYNAERYVGECLTSLANQTFTDFEVIVADDCSIDNSLAVVQKFFANFDNRLTVLKLSQNSAHTIFPPPSCLNCCG